jgi:hypothetical protein
MMASQIPENYSHLSESERCESYLEFGRACERPRVRISRLEDLLDRQTEDAGRRREAAHAANNDGRRGARPT